jgi:protein-S-isoprenylcysteine O-methyltransferase Ste14
MKSNLDIDSRGWVNEKPMSKTQNKSHWREYVLSCIWGSLLAAQIVLVLVFGKYNEAGMDVVMYLGWVVWAVSVVFGWLPILVLKRKGGVKKGKSYVATSVLVDSGLYSIVRHPQYTAGILWSLALVLVSQNWLVVAMGLVVIVTLYLDILKADKHEIEKFGDAYKRYMKKVPRTNFILGIVRLLRRM